MRILLIDNHDSFTYNLVQGLQALRAEVVVRKNDAVSVPDAEEIRPAGIVFSPGPGDAWRTEDVGTGLEILKMFRGRVPILGVCLGHQMIAHFLGGKIEATQPRHGKKERIRLLNHSGLFKDLPDEVDGMRYHSQVVVQKDLPAGLMITAESAEGEIRRKLYLFLPDGSRVCCQK